MPSSPVSREQFLALVAAGIQAPSADNHHPLLFDQHGDSIRIWMEQPLRASPLHRRILLRISLGAVAENLKIKAHALGYAATIQWFPDPADDRLATHIQLSPAATSDDLAPHIEARHTNRRLVFRGPPLALAELAKLQADATSVGPVRLLWLDDPALRRSALRLIRLAEGERFCVKALHEELFSCIRFDLGWNEIAEQGLSPGSLEVEKPLRPFFKALRHWPLMAPLGAFGVQHLLALRAGDIPSRLSPHVGVLAADGDLEEAALAAGRALERVWLRATSWNLALQPLAGSALFSLEGCAAVRPVLREALVRGWSAIVPGSQPMMVFRLGRAAPASLRSGRRSVSAYLR